LRLLTDLIDGEVSEEVARELVERLRVGYGPEDWDDELLAKARLARLIEEEIDCCGPLTVTPGRRRLVALVGPTGVGKTTTVAKLAAEFHLRQRCRVGLITVDTYRIAAWTNCERTPTSSISPWRSSPRRARCERPWPVWRTWTWS